MALQAEWAIIHRAVLQNQKAGRLQNAVCFALGCMHDDASEDGFLRRKAKTEKDHIEFLSKTPNYLPPSPRPVLVLTQSWAEASPGRFSTSQHAGTGYAAVGLAGHQNAGLLPVSCLHWLSRGLKNVLSLEASGELGFLRAAQLQSTGPESTWSNQETTGNLVPKQSSTSSGCGRRSSLATSGTQLPMPARHSFSVKGKRSNCALHSSPRS